MSLKNKWSLKKFFKSNGGCGCGPNSTDIIEPKPKSKPLLSDQKPRRRPSSSASSSDIHGVGQPVDDDDDYTSTTFSLNLDNDGPETNPSRYDQMQSWKPLTSTFSTYTRTQIRDDYCTKSSTTVTSCPKIRGSLAVVKDSDDPYHDFRQSMLQMIFEKELYSKNDLQQLLECFLRLNSPHHHEIIVQAFMEIWNGGEGGGEEETPPCSSSRIT
ncbi:hypothetical protein BUALT_Bualt13G0055400 [Buddleja alternifolia]|uniref:Transcription repressor n=1 Tax=Buddleja alternifolia TaxID=168488 RepID=A0AAV6WKR4_9LAMI|nr:hypothetical protein BUALT_Bualt13G0055400 [Buddleja alternifolia]